MGVAAVGRVGQRNPVRKGARNFGGRCLAPCSGSGFRCVLEGLYGSDVPIYPGFDKIVHICPIQKRKHMSVRWFCVPAVASGLRAFLCFRRVCADVIGKPDGGRPPCDARSYAYLAVARFPPYVQKRDATGVCSIFIAASNHTHFPERRCHVAVASYLISTSTTLDNFRLSNSDTIDSLRSIAESRFDFAKSLVTGQQYGLVK